MDKSAQQYLPDALGARLLDEWERGSMVADDGGLRTALGTWLALWDELPSREVPWFEREYDFPIASVLCDSIAEAYRELQEPTVALEYARRLETLSTNPIDTNRFLVLGMAALDAGEEAEALEAFGRAHEMGGHRAFKERPAAYWEFFRSARQAPCGSGSEPPRSVS